MWWWVFPIIFCVTCDVTCFPFSGLYYAGRAWNENLLLKKELCLLFKACSLILDFKDYIML